MRSFRVYRTTYGFLIWWIKVTKQRGYKVSDPGLRSLQGRAQALLSAIAGAAQRLCRRTLSHVAVRGGEGVNNSRNCSRSCYVTGAGSASGQCGIFATKVRTRGGFGANSRLALVAPSFVVYNL